ncbi:MAG: glycosyltransferase family 4 protein [Prevotella sp.]|nr:glycosyltransferase family 4 protein [Prevotella sp.]
MDKKKVLRITTADISLDRLLKGQLHFLNQFYEVVGVASDTGVLNAVSEREDIRVVNIPMHREISLWNDLKSLCALYRLFRREKPFIVHANTPKGSLLSMVAAWAARIHNRIYLVTGLRYQGATGIMRVVLKMMERISCIFATVVIPEGNGVKKILIEDNICKNPANVLHHGNINGIDTSFFSSDVIKGSKDEIRRQLGIGQDDFVFVFIGRIVRDKGMHELVYAMKRLEERNVKLLLVGRFEPDMDPLELEDDRYLHDSKNVVFVGWQKDVRPFLKAADALVFPSYREGFPNVPLQAGAMGLPSIVTDINGCNEIIIERENGLIVPSRDSEPLYTKMKWMMENSKEAQRMGQNARPIIQSRFEQQDVWNALLSFYNSL